MGIDCGSQSAKVVIHDARGSVMASAQHTLAPTLRPEPGVVVHPEDDLWTSICAATQAALAEFAHPAAEIVAVGLCPIRCCKAFLDAEGELTEPVISWMDDRAYQPYVPDDPSMAWATTSSGYLGHRFTGNFVDTAANCIALQWPIDPDTWRWSPAAVAESEFTADQLPTLVDPGDVIGSVTASAAAATGLVAGTPVVATANDKAVELLGMGPLADDTAVVSLGTYIAGMMSGDRHHAGAQEFWSNFAAVPGRYIHESGGVRRGMWTLTWFLDLLGPEFAAHVAREGSSREAWIEQEATEVPPGADGLTAVLDWLAPTDHPYRKGSLLGFDARHRRGHIYRAIIEAIALTMHANIGAMVAEADRDLRSLVLSGGGANSPLFMQVFADVFGLPASRATGAAGASMGAAMLAAAAVGLHPDIDTAVAVMASERETFAPNLEATDRYREIASTIRSHLPAATDPLYEHSFPLFN